MAKCLLARNNKNIAFIEHNFKFIILNIKHLQEVRWQCHSTNRVCDNLSLTLKAIYIKTEPSKCVYESQIPRKFLMAFKHWEFANCIFDVRIYEWEHSVVIVKEQKANCRTISSKITHIHVTTESGMSMQ